MYLLYTIYLTLTRRSGRNELFQTFYSSYIYASDDPPSFLIGTRLKMFALPHQLTRLIVHGTGINYHCTQQSLTSVLFPTSAVGTG